MDGQPDISVVISTYNRSGLLAAAIESVLMQEADGVRYEVIVVDNNSTDQTRQVVDSIIARHHSNLRYVFEGEQGVSHARNAGIAKARAPIIAFFDDDVCVSRDWIITIWRTFSQHPEVDCIGGKVLPQWESPPPGWLTVEHWAPLALQDYGDSPFYVNTENPIGLISANLSFRREVFGRIGPFLPELQRVKSGIGSMEDHELILRFWRAGLQGLYVPELVARTYVPAERMTKAYHRRWHTGHGRFYAMMRSEEMDGSDSGRLFDVPAHLYKQTFIHSAQWLRFSLSGNKDRAFLYETTLRFFAGFFRKRREDFTAARRRSAIREVAAFIRAIATGKKGRSRTG